LQDLPEDCLYLLWHRHRGNYQIRDWVNEQGPGVFGPEWVDIETHARSMGWPSLAAAARRQGGGGAVARQQGGGGASGGGDAIGGVTGAGGGGNGTSGGDAGSDGKEIAKKRPYWNPLLSDSECRKRAKQVMINATAGDSDREYGDDITEMIQCAILGKQTTASTQGSCVQELEGEGVDASSGERLEKSNNEGQGEDRSNKGTSGGNKGTSGSRSRSSSPEPRQVYSCRRRIDHLWEECNNLRYVTKGVLNGRSCNACGVEMRGEPRKPDDEQGGHWPSTRQPAFHCTHCKKVLCSRCKRVFDEGTPPRRDHPTDDNDDGAA
jgi:hypothetical protein